MRLYLVHYELAAWCWILFSVSDLHALEAAHDYEPACYKEGLEILPGWFRTLLDKKDDPRDALPDRYVPQVDCRNMTEILEIFDDIQESCKRLRRYFFGLWEIKKWFKEICADYGCYRAGRHCIETYLPELCAGLVPDCLSTPYSVCDSTSSSIYRRNLEHIINTTVKYECKHALVGLDSDFDLTTATKPSTEKTTGPTQSTTTGMPAGYMWYWPTRKPEVHMPEVNGSKDEEDETLLWPECYKEGMALLPDWYRELRAATSGDPRPFLPDIVLHQIDCRNISEAMIKMPGLLERCSIESFDHYYQLSQLWNWFKEICVKYACFYAGEDCIRKRAETICAGVQPMCLVNALIVCDTTINFYREGLEEMVQQTKDRCQEFGFEVYTTPPPPNTTAAFTPTSQSEANGKDENSMEEYYASLDENTLRKMVMREKLKRSKLEYMKLRLETKKLKLEIGELEEH